MTRLEVKFTATGIVVKENGKERPAYSYTAGETMLEDVGARLRELTDEYRARYPTNAALKMPRQLATDGNA